ncbi:MAG: class I SAM-dependent methyltransferase [Sedimentisphaerales bacterium]|nr:class I SAM-dependent methyltransferase [Sedimentisphaerales bacterium]
MENVRDFWRKLWNQHAASDNMFVQIGRSSYTPLEFALAIRDICKALDFNKEDIVLDAGAAVGWISMFISPFVKKIVLFDYAEEMVSKAKELTAYFDNIQVEHDDILFMKKIDGQFTKVISASILQYLENKEQVMTALSNIYKVMAPGGKAMFAHHPDLKKKAAHLDSYNRLDWDKEKIKQSLEMEEKRLWFDIEEIGKMASKTGFSKCYELPINSKLWQSTHMIDFVVEK